MARTDGEIKQDAEFLREAKKRLGAQKRNAQNRDEPREAGTTLSMFKTLVKNGERVGELNQNGEVGSNLRKLLNGEVSNGPRNTSGNQWIFGENITSIETNTQPKGGTCLPSGGNSDS